MDIPAVPVGHRQGHIVPIQDLYLTNRTLFKIEPKRQGLQVMHGFPGETQSAGEKDCGYKEGCNGLFSAHRTFDSSFLWRGHHQPGRFSLSIDIGIIHFFRMHGENGKRSGGNGLGRVGKMVVSGRQIL